MSQMKESSEFFIGVGKSIFIFIDQTLKSFGSTQRRTFSVEKSLIQVSFQRHWCVEKNNKVGYFMSAKRNDKPQIQANADPENCTGCESNCEISQIKSCHKYN